MKKNDVLQLSIQSLNSDGVGVGRHEGMVVFVGGALPCELVECKVIKLKKNFAIARLERVLNVAEERVEPPCKHFQSCGGCTLQHMSYPAQLQFKGQRVLDSMQRIGGIDISMPDVVASPQQYGYRNKAAFPFAPGNNGLLAGPFASKSHRIVDVENCIIQHEKSAAVLAALRDYAAQNCIPAYDEKTGAGILRHMLLRVSSLGKAVLTLVCREMPPLSGLEGMAQRLGIDGVVININDKNTNVILGDEYHTIYGDGDLDENICGIRLKVSPASFLQVNHAQCQKLYLHALDLAGLQAGDTVIDAYCGIGSMSLLFAKHAAKVYGIECVQKAVDNAVYNAGLNGSDAEFICGFAEDIIPTLGVHSDVLLLDPPRKGCDQRLLQNAITKRIERIVYVSCNPSTLARDAAILCEGGYRLLSLKAFDMFPQTSHVECAALFVYGNQI